jgi:hypothetical protein
MKFQHFMKKNLGFHQFLYFSSHCNFLKFHIEKKSKKLNIFKHILITMKLEKVLWYTICMLKKKKIKAMELSYKEILYKTTLYLHENL